MLQVWLRAQHSPLAVWHADTEQWQLVEGWQQLQDSYNSYRAGKDKRLCLYFPSSHMLQVDSELTASQLKQLGDSGKQYLFEETSITPVEQLMVRQQSYAHFHHLYALAKEDIDSWQQSAILAGFSIGALLPDFLLLPVPEEGAGQQVVLYEDKHTTLLRQSLQQGMAVSYLPLVFERLTHFGEVCLMRAIDDSVATIESSQLAQQQVLSTKISAYPTPIDIADRHPLNFFVKSADHKLSPYLTVAAMVALAALVLQMAADGLQIYRYNAASAATQSAISKQYQSWFPEDRLNPRTLLQTQMQAKLRRDSQAQAPHMALLARISPLIKQSSLTAQSLVMQPNALSFTLIAPDRNSLDEFTNTLVTQGIAASLQTVNSTEQGKFSGQISVNLVDNNREAGKLSS